MHGISRVVIEQLRGDYRGEPLLGDLTPTAVFALCFAWPAPWA
jgi:phosphatidylglycerol:prolipoprotein diacylglycerol transferase